MKQRLILLSLLALAAIVVAACGGAAAAPETAPPTETAMDTDGATVVPRADADPTMKDDTDAMVQDDPDSMETGEADKTVKDDADAVMADDSDTTAKDDPDATMVDESDPTDKDNSAGSMEAEHSDDVSATSEKDLSMDQKATVDLPPWFSAQLTDVNSNSSFSVSDHQGKVILVETIAVWCSNCLRQQREVKRSTRFWASGMISCPWRWTSTPTRRPRSSIATRPATALTGSTPSRHSRWLARSANFTAINSSAHLRHRCSSSTGTARSTRSPLASRAPTISRQRWTVPERRDVIVLSGRRA